MTRLQTYTPHPADAYHTSDPARSVVARFAGITLPASIGEQDDAIVGPYSNELWMYLDRLDDPHGRDMLEDQVYGTVIDPRSMSDSEFDSWIAQRHARTIEQISDEAERYDVILLSMLPFKRFLRFANTCVVPDAGVTL